MKKLYLQIFALLYIAVIASCGNSNEEKISIAVTPTSIELPASGGVVEVAVTASGKWSATSSNNKFVVNPASAMAAGATKVFVSANINNGSEESGVVTFSAGEISATLSVKQQSLLLKLEPTELTFISEAETKTLNLECNDAWEINLAAKPEWIEKIEPLKGKGNATITVTTLKTKIKEDIAPYKVGVACGNAKVTATLKKESAKNHIPTAPVLTAPKDGSTDVNLLPIFMWKASQDEDEDKINYTLCYSTDNATWKEKKVGVGTSFNSLQLGPNTKCYWKVVADDNYGGKTESEVFTLTTRASLGAYSDYEYRLYQKSKYPEEFILVFSGDGYTKDMFDDGGKFDYDVDKCINGLFDIEPYKTYRDYFTIYKIAAYSNEAGVSIENKVSKDTRYGCVWEGGNSTGMSCTNTDALDRAWATIPELSSDDAQTKAPFCIVVNAEIYAGTNSVFYDSKWGGVKFKSHCMVPLGDPTYSTPIEAILQHEFGGHCIGLLEDEYGYSKNGTASPEAIQNMQGWRKYGPLGFGWNVAFSSNIAESPWAQFNIKRYTDMGLGMYEGGGTYVRGIWRPEYTSCMVDNQPWYNVQSRWLIYKRIMWTLGKTATLEDFMAHDNETQSSVTSKASNIVRSTSPEFRPLAPVKFVKGEDNPYNRK